MFVSVHHRMQLKRSVNFNIILLAVNSNLQQMVYPSIFIFLTLILHAHAQTVPPQACQSHGYIESATISLSSTSANSIANLQSQIYSYTLANPFINNPNIIIGMTSFQSIASPYLMLSIKPLPVSSLSSLSFFLRYYYRYTTWKLVNFNFLAEDRADLQVGYYEIDTRQLSLPQSGKAIQIQIPFTSDFANLQALYFLNGFQIATSATFDNTFSPFQIQVIGVSQTNKILNFVVSSTTETQVYSLLLSYLIYDTSSTYYKSGNYQYNSLTAASFLTLPLNVISTPTFIFGGVNGFIVPNIEGNTQLSAQFSNNSVTFISKPALNYLTFQYLILSVESPCFYCENLPYLYQGTCLSACPNNTQLINNICTQCQFNQIWNGSICINRCLGGSTWNVDTQSCICPTFSNWDGSTCVFCPQGQTWISSSLKCGCPTNQYWNSYACVPIPLCESNKVFDTISFMCACPLNSPWDGVKCANCSNGFVWNTQSSSCTCPSNSNYNGVQCITCWGGMIYDAINAACVCPANTAWNGTNCVTACVSPFVLTNGQCACPAGMILSSNTCVVAPVCPQGLLWLNNNCQNVTCIPGYVWNGTYCIQYVPSCPLNTYWNGVSCVGSNIQCPTGSFWNGSYCLPTSTSCAQGSYFLNGQCVAFPQLCLPNYSWNGSKCLLVGISITCQLDQYFNGDTCVDSNCSMSGQIWNSQLVQCVCPSDSYWNGAQCISCPLGQIYGSNGCNCISGYFLVNGTCYNLLQIYCVLVNYAQWDGQNCVCNPGFSAVGINCICNGVIVGSTCNQCINIPNSQLVNGSCECIDGYYKSKGQCIPFTTSVDSRNVSCNPGTLFDAVHKVCVSCSDGCLSCLTQTVCLQCRLEYNYNWATYLCEQICGDGKRFTLQCDDGNNLNGDGCSADCRIEPDYTCYGGSPNSPDFCTKYLPSQIVLNLTGTTHLYGKIIANIRSNYLPSNLTNPSIPCTDLCQQILQASVSGQNSYISLQTQYLVGSAGFSFSVVVDFSVEPIGIFSLSVRMNPAISQIYFPGVDSSQVYSFTINPAFLSIAQNTLDQLSI